MSIGWRFSRSSTDEGRSGGNPSEYTFDHDLMDFVRETLQNSNDAGQGRSGTTSVTYKLRKITGEELEEFLRSLQWNEDALSETGRGGETLEDHVRRVADENTDATLSHVYNEIKDGRLLVVTVEDENTHGLYGPEGGKGSFSALVLDELITQKEGGSGAGGSYGLGKAVLWSWSGLKTVFFTSSPEETGEEEPPRLIARTQLPTHEADSDIYRYEGRGLFGSLSESESATAVDTDGGDIVYKWGGSGRPYSVWGDSASSIADELGVGRAEGEYGTSVSVLGFCEPGGKTQPSPEDLAPEIAKEASKWFWPAMLQGSLEVSVETDESEIEVEPDTHEAVRPFIQCVQKRNSTREILDQPGDVGLEMPTFEIENKEDTAVEESENTDTENGSVNVYARLADPDNAGSLSNKVALIRGSGMVVKYYDRNRIVYGGRKFHGVVLAGKARPWTDEDPSIADEDIDDYLQAAEPPRHDDWEYTKNLKSKYGTDSRSTIVGFQRNVITDAIKDLIRQTREEGRLVAGRLANRLNIPEGRGEDSDESGGNGGGGTQVLQGTSEISFENSEDRWEFSGFGELEVDDHEAWEAEVTLQRLDEENNVVGTVPIQSLESDATGVYIDDSGETATIRGREDIDTFRFSGYSATNPFRGETQINVKGRVFVGRLEV